jgi:hypothetical protein
MESVMREVSDFRSLMGMWEMEKTVCQVVNQYEAISDKPVWADVILNRKDFIGDAALGFSCLLEYGWLNKLPDGSFSMHPTLIERIVTRLQNGYGVLRRAD